MLRFGPDQVAGSEWGSSLLCPWSPNEIARVFFPALVVCLYNVTELQVHRLVTRARHHSLPVPSSQVCCKTCPYHLIPLIYTTITQTEPSASMHFPPSSYQIPNHSNAYNSGVDFYYAVYHER
jgi:hypothetical protein